MAEKNKDDKKKDKIEDVKAWRDLSSNRESGFQKETQREVAEKLKRSGATKDDLANVFDLGSEEQRMLLNSSDGELGVQLAKLREEKEKISQEKIDAKEKIRDKNEKAKPKKHRLDKMRDQIMKSRAKQQKGKKKEKKEALSKSKIENEVEEKNPESEVKNDNRNEKDEKLIELGEAVDKARRKYIEKDYKMDRKLKNIMRFFGRMIKTDKYEEEIMSYKEEYENAKKEYKDAIMELEWDELMEDAKSQDNTAQEEREYVEIMARSFYINEQLKWHSDRVDVAMENNPIFENFKKYSLMMVDKYRKVRNMPADKIAKITNSKLIGITSGVAIVGGAFKLAGLGANMPWRMVSATVATVGYKQMLESFAEGLRAERNEREIKEAIDEFGIDADRFDKWLDEKNSDLHKSIQSEKYYRNWRTIWAAGAGAGTVFGGSWLGKEIIGMFNSDGSVSTSASSEATLGTQGSASGNINISQPESANTGGPQAQEAAVGKAGEIQADTPKDFDAEADNSNTQIENSAIEDNPTNQKFAGIETYKDGGGTLEIKSGSSVKDTLAGFLKQNSHKLTEGGMGFNEDEIGPGKRFSSIDDWANKRAIGIVGELMKDDPSYNYNKVSADSVMLIDFSDPADIHIQGVYDPLELGKLEEAGNVARAEISNESSAETSPESVESSLSQEAEYAHRMGIDPEHYAKINDVSAKEVIMEVNEYTKNPITSGDYDDSVRYLSSLNQWTGTESGIEENIKLGKILEHAVNNNPEINADQSVGEILRSVDKELFKDAVNDYSREYGADDMAFDDLKNWDSGEYIATIVREELREILISDTRAGRVMQAIAAVKEQPMNMDGTERPQLDAFQEAVRKTVGKIEPRSDETVGKYILRVIREAYEGGKINKLKGALSGISLDR